MSIHNTQAISETAVIQLTFQFGGRIYTCFLCMCADSIFLAFTRVPPLHNPPPPPMITPGQYNSDGEDQRTTSVFYLFPCIMLSLYLNSLLSLECLPLPNTHLLCSPPPPMIITHMGQYNTDERTQKTTQCLLPVSLAPCMYAEPLSSLTSLGLLPPPPPNTHLLCIPHHPMELPG